LFAQTNGVIVVVYISVIFFVLLTDWLVHDII